jgi:hypothetical protein
MMKLFQIVLLSGDIGWGGYAHKSGFPTQQTGSKDALMIV